MRKHTRNTVWWSLVFICSNRTTESSVIVTTIMPNVIVTTLYSITTLSCSPHTYIPQPHNKQRSLPSPHHRQYHTTILFTTASQQTTVTIDITTPQAAPHLPMSHLESSFTKHTGVNRVKVTLLWATNAKVGKGQHWHSCTSELKRSKNCDAEDI